MKHTDIDPGDANHPCWSSPAGPEGADDPKAAAHPPGDPHPGARDRYLLAAVRQRLGAPAPAPLKAQA